MQLEALKIFCDIATFRSFSRAAEVNHLTQPAVSRIVHQLEARLKGQLIDRSHRPLQLTALGQAYFEGCKRIMEEYSKLEASLLNDRAQLLVTIRVAAIYSVGLGNMKDYKKRFEQEHPHAWLHIDYMHPDEVYQSVIDGTAEFGVVSFPQTDRDVQAIPWRDEELVVACAPNHPLAGLDLLSPQQLEGEKFVAFHPRLVIRREVDRFLSDHHVNVDIVSELDNVASIKDAVKEGTGVALLPEPLLRQDVKDGSLSIAHLQGCRLVRPLGFIQRRRHPPSDLALAFLAMLQSNAAIAPAAATRKSPARNR